MTNQQKNGNKADKILQKADEELGYLWKNYVIEEENCKIIRRRRTAIIVAVLILIVGALFVDDDLAWGVVATVRASIAQVLQYAADNIAHALGVQRH